MSIICIQSINEKKNHIRYEVDTDSQPLGVGGMGSVYRGKRIQEKTGVCVDVAIKFLFDDLPAHVIERARREASIQIHNENLVEMFGFIQIDEVVSPTVVHQHYHVVSELLHGVVLCDLCCWIWSLMSVRRFSCHSVTEYWPNVTLFGWINITSSSVGGI